LSDLIKIPQGGLVTSLRKIRSGPATVLWTIKAALMGNRFLK